MSVSGVMVVLDPGDLIEEVRRRPVVYEDRHRKDRSAVEEAWNDISRLLGADVQTCKLKWYDLRNSYLGRRKRKYKSRLLSFGKVGQFNQYFDSMTFLDSEETREKDIDDMLDQAHKAQNIDSTAKHDAEMKDVDSLKTTIPRIHFSPGTLGLFPKCRNEADVMEAASSESTDPRLGDFDSDLHFLLSLLPLMKQLSPQDNLDIRIQIQSAFKGKLFPVCSTS